MTEKVTRNMSRNFTFAEFEESPTAKAKGIVNVINTFEIRDSIVALVRDVLQPLRDIYGKPMKVNSGYRCPELNAAVGGVATSQHTKGEAADIHTGSEAESYRLAKLAKDAKLPYDQLILYPTFVHISHKLKGEQRQRILYNSSYRGKKF